MALVEVTPESFGVELDLVYATEHNFTGRRVYRRAACYLHVDTAELLGRAIDLAAARGVAIACALPCVGVTTLEAVAAAVEMTEHAGRNLLVALRSRRAELYVQGFDGAGSPLGPASAVLPSELVGHVPAPVVVVGDASADAVQAFEAAGVEAVIADAPGVADPGNVTAIAALRWASGEDVVLPAPLYLRSPDAIRPRNGGRLRP